MHAKRAHDGALHRQFFLILGRDTHRAHRARTLRTVGGQRRLIALVDGRRHAAMRARSIAGPGFAPRPTGLRHARAAREGRRLPRHRPARGVEFVFQFLVFPAQPLAFRFGAPEIVAQPIHLSTLLVDDPLRVLKRRGLVALRHALVMPDSRRPYKRKSQRLGVSVCRDWREARVSPVLTR